MSENNILAVDIGSSKIIAVVVAKEDDGAISIIGIGEEKSEGIEKGKIIDLEKATMSLNKAVKKAQNVANTHIQEVFITVSGAITRSVNSRGSININTGEIDTKEIANVLNTSKIQANLPSEFEILHILPRYFKVDEQEKLKNPIGMTGKRLEVETRIVMAQTSLLNNLRKIVSSCGLEIKNFVLSGYASSLSLINQSDKNFGMALVDIGGGVSDIVVYSGGTINFDDFIAVGSNHITNDIAKHFSSSPKVAENIKRQHGTLVPFDEDELELHVPQNNNDENNKNNILRIQHIIHARVEETLILINEKIKDSGYADMLGSGVIITGGMTKIAGFEKFASKVFGDLNVIVGIPKDNGSDFVNFSDSTKSAILGLVEYATTNKPDFEIDSNNQLRAKITIETKSNPKTDINIDKIKDAFYSTSQDTSYKSSVDDSDKSVLNNTSNDTSSSKKKFVDLDPKKGNDKKSIWAKIVDLF
jgi:cell division protein FtsA